MSEVSGPPEGAPVSMRPMLRLFLLIGFDLLAIALYFTLWHFFPQWWWVWLIMLLIDLPGTSWLVLRWTAPDEPESPVG